MPIMISVCGTLSDMAINVVLCVLPEIRPNQFILMGLAGEDVWNQNLNNFYGV